MTRRALVEAARGDRALDLVIRGGQLVNVFTEEIQAADVGVFGDRIAVVDVGRAYGLEAREVIDATGLTLIPGIIDSHIHIESTMVTPPSYARGVLPFGTTSVVIDPHEIGKFRLRRPDGLIGCAVRHFASVNGGHGIHSGLLRALNAPPIHHRKVWYLGLGLLTR